MAIDIKISPENILEWSHMEDWVSGASSAPTNHTLSGAGASVARESTIVKVGTYSAKVTRAGADTTLYHDYADYDDYQKRKVTFGCWVYATVADRVRIAISDGVGSTNSSYHPGDSSWDWIEVTHDVDASATRLRVEMHVNTGNTSGYFDGGTLCEGNKTFNFLTDNVDIGRMTPSTRFRGQQFNIARHDGIFMPNHYAESKSMRVEGMVVEADSATARTTYDTLVQDLTSSRIKPNEDREMKELYLFDDRKLQVHVNTISRRNMAALKVIDFDVRFTAPDPTEMSVQKYRSKTTIDSSPKTATVTTAGNFVTHCVMTITAGAADITALTIENLTKDQIFTYNGTISSGEALVVDTDKLTVLNNGADDITNVSNEIDILLVPGANAFKYTITGGSTDSTIEVDWYDRWL